MWSAKPSAQRTHLKQENYSKGTTTVVMNRRDKIEESQKQLVKWFEQTLEPPRIPVFSTLTKMQKLTLSYRDRPLGNSTYNSRDCNGTTMAVAFADIYMAVVGQNILEDVFSALWDISKEEINHFIELVNS